MLLILIEFLKISPPAFRSATSAKAPVEIASVISVLSC